MSCSKQFLIWWDKKADSPLKYNVNIVELLKEAFCAGFEQADFIKNFKPYKEDKKENPICQRKGCYCKAKTMVNNKFFCKRHYDQYKKDQNYA